VRKHRIADVIRRCPGGHHPPASRPPPATERDRAADPAARCSQKHALADSFAAFIGHPAYNTGTLCVDLHRFVSLLGASDGEGLFGEPTP
jgi:hypothetical protein